MDEGIVSKVLFSPKRKRSINVLNQGRLSPTQRQLEISPSVEAAAEILEEIKAGGAEGGGGGGGGGGDAEAEGGGGAAGVIEAAAAAEAEGEGGSEAVPVPQSVSEPLQDFWKLLWHCDVRKDHPDDYTPEAVNGILPVPTIGGNPAPAGRNITKDILFANNCRIQPTGPVPQINTVGFQGTATITECSVPGTQYTVSSFKLNSTTYEDSKRLEEELKAFLGPGSFLKYIDTTRHGGELLTHWDNSTGTQLRHAHTALIEMDPAYKINPLTNPDEDFKEKFFYEAQPSIIEYPPFTQAVPLSYTYCKKLFCVHNNGLIDYGRKRLNTKFVYFYTPTMPIELTGKAEGNDNTAGNLCKFLTKITNALGLTRTSDIDKANTEAFFVSKHHGDIGQVLEQYRPSALVNSGGTSLNSKDYNFIFESIDINAISKAFSIGVDCVFMHIQDTLVVFKNTNLDTPEARAESLRKEAEREIASFITYKEEYNKNVDIINSKLAFHTAYKKSLLKYIETPEVREGVEAVVASASASVSASASPLRKSGIIAIQNTLSDAVYRHLNPSEAGVKGEVRGYADAYACKQITNPNERYKFFLKKILAVCVLGEYIPKTPLQPITITKEDLEALGHAKSIIECNAARSKLPLHYMTLDILTADGNNIADIKIPKTVIFEGSGDIQNCSSRMEYQWDMVNVLQTNQGQFKSRRNSVTPCFHKEWATDILIHLYRNLPSDFPAIYTCVKKVLDVRPLSQTFFTQITELLGIAPVEGGGGGGGGGGMSERKSQFGGSLFSKTSKKKGRKNTTLKLRVQHGGDIKNLNRMIDELYGEETAPTTQLSIDELRTTMLLQARMYLEMLAYVASANGNAENQRLAISEFMSQTYGMRLGSGSAPALAEEQEQEQEKTFMLDIGNTPDTIYSLIQNSPPNDDKEKIKELLRILNGNIDDIFNEGYLKGSTAVAKEIYELTQTVVDEESNSEQETQSLASGYLTPVPSMGAYQGRHFIGLNAFKGKISHLYATVTKQPRSPSSSSSSSSSIALE